MPCIANPDRTPAKKARQVEALKRLLAAIESATIKVVVGRAGSVAFAGWTDREDITDLCAYRALANAPALRRAVFRAEALSGHKMDPRAIAAGMHSHDGGGTWSTH